MTLALGERSVRVRELQRALVAAGIQVVADGILGTETLGGLVEYARQIGVPFTLPADVLAELESDTLGEATAPGVRLPGCWFAPGSNRNTRARTEPIRSVLLHWTGGSGDAERVYRTLQARALSVHYVVDVSGRVVQMADHSTRCAHAGRANDWSIGIECVSRGVDSGAEPMRWMGRKIRLATWPAEQLAAVVRLVSGLCDAHGIPRRIAPERRDVASDWAGVMGHAHVHASKTDPGPFPFSVLEAAGFARAT